MLGNCQEIMKRQKNIINGWLNISKPVGVTSNDIIFWMKRVLSPLKIGHAGTLDPFATGVLQIALGEATKAVEYAQERKKTYNFTLQFGHETTTEDTEGTPTIICDKIPTIEEINNIVPEFMGAINQTPPRFSAVKINGQRAYDLARNDQEFEIKSKIVNIYELKLNKQLDENKFYFTVTCGKGTYIRSLGRDMARTLGSAGHLIQLERSRVGGFALEDAIILENRETTLQLGEEYFISRLKSVDAVLDDIPVLHLGTDDIKRLRNGVKIEIAKGNSNTPQESKLVRVYDKNALSAFASIEANIVKPVKIINY